MKEGWVLKLISILLTTSLWGCLAYQVFYYPEVRYLIGIYILCESTIGWALRPTQKIVEPETDQKERHELTREVYNLKDYVINLENSQNLRWKQLGQKKKR